MTSAIIPSVEADISGSDITESINKKLARHKIQRRQMLSLTGICWGFNAGLVLLYAMAGTTSFEIATSYFLTGLAYMAVLLLLSEVGFNDRFQDHYLAGRSSVVTVLLHLAFLYRAPEIASVFTGGLFVIFSFVTLRAPLRQMAVSGALTLAISAMILLTLDRPLGFPSSTTAERLITLLGFALTLGCCIGLGLFGNAKRTEFYQRTLDLQVAKRRIEELAQTDELTGAFNRRRLMQLLDEEAVRVQRTGAPFSVALIDLDHFKRINDRFGHPVGDEVLRMFALTAFANIRASDRFGRYGGEEFLLLMPDTPSDTAAILLDRLRAVTADTDWSDYSSDLRVTMSAGVSALRPGEAPDALLARADMALYRSKDQGRNQVTTA